MEQRPVFSNPCQSFWPGVAEYPTPEQLLQGAASRSRLPALRPAPHRRSAAPAWLAALGARLLWPGSLRSAFGRGRGAPPHALPHPRPPGASPVAAPPAMSRGSRLVLAVSALLSAAIVAAVHIQQRRELERLRSGVVRDLERQNQKKENIRLLEEQIALTKQLMEERDKMVTIKRSQQS